MNFCLISGFKVFFARVYTSYNPIQLPRNLLQNKLNHVSYFLFSNTAIYCSVFKFYPLTVLILDMNESQHLFPV